MTAEGLLKIEEDTQKGKFLTFNLAKEVYGLEIKYVTEIIGIQSITEVPELPDYIKGIINLRGKIIPVIDVRLRFRKPFIEYNDRTCIIVVELQDTLIGLIVDGVSEVIAIADEHIEPPPNFSRDYYNKYIKGIGKVGNEIKMLLDCERIFNDNELEGISGLGE